MAESSFTRRFPQYLHRAIQILWFEIDEVVVFILTLTLALIYGSVMWILFVAVQVIYIRTKRRKARGFLKHFLYVLGFVKLKQYPEYFEQEFHE